MAISIIRKANDDDRARINASAQRFAQRHGITLDVSDKKTEAVALDDWLWSHDIGTWPHAKALTRLWQSCRCRALGIKPAAGIVIAHGYVGRSVT